MTLMQETRDRLRHMILDMEIGPGERLTERGIEAQLGASRTSIRAALFGLEAEGLVAREGRSWIVPPIDADEIEQLYVYREVLEVAALRLATLPIAPEEIAEVEAILASVTNEAPPEQIDDAGRGFHLWIAGLARNVCISRGIADAMTRLQRVRWLENDPEHHGWAEHRAIVTALKDNQVDRAADLMAAHTRQSRDRLLDTLRQGRRSLRARGIIVR